MNFDEALIQACDEPTLADALSWIAVWESERAIHQALAHASTGVRTGSHGGAWDTCFKHCFTAVLERYAPPEPRPEAEGRPDKEPT